VRTKKLQETVGGSRLFSLHFGMAHSSTVPCVPSSTARNEQRAGATPEAQQDQPIEPCHGNAALGGIAPKMTVTAMNTARAHVVANQNSRTVRLLVCMAVDLDVMVVIQGIHRSQRVLCPMHARAARGGRDGAGSGTSICEVGEMLLITSGTDDVYPIGSD
jgi:hypothetical protein